MTATRQRLDLFPAKEQEVLSEIEQIMLSLRRIMHRIGYNDGDPLPAEDQSYILDNVFAHHPDKEAKPGAGIDHLMVSIEDVKDRLNRNAKMRHLLFRHELKAKHIKKIKSKTYHRLEKKYKLKTAMLDLEADLESAKEPARKQEFKRAKERMTLRHKNKSKWAKRILQCGLDA